MSWFATFYRSAMGKKTVMAVTGVILFGFVLVHMLGNLKLYQGPEKLNHYAEWLREVGSPALPHEGFLWIARLVLLAAIGLHVHAAYALTLVNWKARPIGYSKRDYAAASYASRTMRWSGVIVGLFIIFHFMHFTTGTVHPNFDPANVYRNVVIGFSNWWVSGFYILANVLLGVHLSHGLWSMLQTLGSNDSERSSWHRPFAYAFAGLITLGNVSFPVAVLLHLVS